MIQLAFGSLANVSPRVRLLCEIEQGTDELGDECRYPERMGRDK